MDVKNTTCRDCGRYTLCLPVDDSPCERFIRRQFCPPNTDSKTFKVHISAHYKHILDAQNEMDAKRLAWREIAPPCFPYGWHDWNDFNSNVKVELLEGNEANEVTK